LSQTSKPPSNSSASVHAAVRICKDSTKQRVKLRISRSRKSCRRLVTFSSTVRSCSCSSHRHRHLESDLEMMHVAAENDQGSASEARPLALPQIKESFERGTSLKRRLEQPCTCQGCRHGEAKQLQLATTSVPITTSPPHKRSWSVVSLCFRHCPSFPVNVNERLLHSQPLLSTTDPSSLLVTIVVEPDSTHPSFLTQRYTGPGSNHESLDLHH
jgi:hypothetical protein